MDPIAILSQAQSTTILQCHSLYVKLALGTYLVVGSMNLDNGPNFAKATLLPV